MFNGIIINYIDLFCWVFQDQQNNNYFRNNRIIIISPVLIPESIGRALHLHVQSLLQEQLTMSRQMGLVSTLWLRRWRKMHSTSPCRYSGWSLAQILQASQVLKLAKWNQQCYSEHWLLRNYLLIHFSSYLLLLHMQEYVV